MHFVLRGALFLLAVAGVSALAPASAKEPAKTEVKSNSQGTSARANVQSEQVTIPECLEKLSLSQPQQEQIRAIVGDYDADITAVWKQFSDRYMETIGLEGSLLAAIEDNLTEPQRQQVREQRRKVAQHEKSLQGTDSKPNQATAKSTSAVEEEITIAGVSLTPEQEAAADKIQVKYLNRLRSLNRDIQGLHTRLVSLEADKLVQIEKILTKEQLVQLRESRQTAPVGKIAASKRDTP
jgi:hypothetical protein